MSRAWLTALVIAAAGALTPVFLPHLGAPFVWIAALWIIVLGVAAWRARARRPRLALINLTAVCLALGGFEAYLWRASPSSNGDEVRYSKDYFVPHPILGYGPRKGVVTEAVKRHRGEVVYRASYSIDQNGLRVTPAAPAASTSVLFFGGSVTFGEGLNDEQSMPFRVGARYGDSVRVYNFGFHGYGPHQMLAALEHGLTQSIVAGPVSAVVYQAIPAHVVRAAGRAPWDIQGPRYRLDAQGRARFTGRFDDGPGARVAAVLNRSFGYRRIFGLERRVSDGDIALFVAIVSRARQQARRLFPASEFFILLWEDEDAQLYQRVLAALADKGLTVSQVRQLLPQDDDPGRYQIGPHDRHPNALAQDLIAAHVVEDLLGPLITTPR